MPLFKYSFSPSVCELKKKRRESISKSAPNTVSKKRKSVVHHTQPTKTPRRKNSRHTPRVSAPKHPKPHRIQKDRIQKDRIQKDRIQKDRIQETHNKRYSSLKKHTARTATTTKTSSSSKIDTVNIRPKNNFASETKHETWECGYDDGVCKLVNREYTREGDRSFKFPDDDNMSSNDTIRSTELLKPNVQMKSKKSKRQLPLISANRVKLLDLATGVDGNTYCAVAASNNTKKWEQCGTKGAAGCGC